MARASSPQELNKQAGQLGDHQRRTGGAFIGWPGAVVLICEPHEEEEEEEEIKKGEKQIKANKRVVFALRALVIKHNSLRPSAPYSLAGSV